MGRTSKEPQEGNKKQRSGWVIEVNSEEITRLSFWIRRDVGLGFILTLITPVQVYQFSQLVLDLQKSEETGSANRSERER